MKAMKKKAGAGRAAKRGKVQDVEARLVTGLQSASEAERIAAAWALTCLAPRQWGEKLLSGSALQALGAALAIRTMARDEPDVVVSLIGCLVKVLQNGAIRDGTDKKTRDGVRCLVAQALKHIARYAPNMVKAHDKHIAEAVRRFSGVRKDGAAALIYVNTLEWGVSMPEPFDEDIQLGVIEALQDLAERQPAIVVPLTRRLADMLDSSSEVVRKGAAGVISTLAENILYGQLASRDAANLAHNDGKR